MADTNIKYLTWEEMDHLHREIAEQIKNEKFMPEIIIGILRCGMIPATHLAYLLGINSLSTIFVRTTPNDEILVKKNCVPEVFKTTLPEFIKGKKILLIDTVMASGTTMNLAIEAILDDQVADLKTAVIVDWPNSPYELKSGKRPTIDFIGTTVDKWPSFPWER
jgi:hypoxanthine phosphoribosyltransferase